MDTFSEFRTAVESRALAVARRHHNDLPADAQARLTFSSDGSMWVDILSKSHFNKTDYSKVDEPLAGEPIFEQYVLAPSDIMKKEAPNFFDKYIKRT